MNKVKPNIKAIKSLLKIGCSRKLIGRIIVFFLATIIITLIVPILSYFSKLIVDMLCETYVIGTTQLINNIFKVVVVVFILTILSLLLNRIKEIEQLYINHDTAKKINTYIYERINSIKYEYFEDAKTYDIITRVSANCPAIYSVLNSFITLAMSIISTISYGILLGSIRWYFILIILIPNILCVWAETMNMFERYFLDISQTNDNRKLSYMHSLFKDKSSNKEIRAFGLCDTLLQKYEDLRIKLYRQSMKLLVKQSIVSFLLLILSKIGLFACLIIVSMLCINGISSIGDISLVLSAGVAFASSFSSIFSQINSVTDKAIYLNDWSVFEAMETESDDAVQINDFETIRFGNVSYKYPNAETFALKSINCKIRKGSTIALVGENGSGKSTFTKLLLGALTPNKGEILVNGQLLSTILHGFRNKIAYIPQNYGTFKITLEDNLKLGNENIDVETYEPKFINFKDKLPDGYATQLGNVYVNGVDLSGGEWQRVSIERALIRDNAEIFIMDEPAASLDPVMESELYKHFTNELKGKTVIITSHRLGACSLADYIYVFDHGKIVEEGSHEDLMKIRGKYFEMYTAQRSLYERSPD